MADAKKILIVEDEDHERTWMTAFFEDNGYETVTAEDGEEGFAKAQSRRTRPDHPGHHHGQPVRGQDVPQPSGNARAEGHSRDHDHRHGRSSNPSSSAPSRSESPAGYFEKPVDRDELLAKVKELIG